MAIFNSFLYVYQRVYVGLYQKLPSSYVRRIYDFSQIYLFLSMHMQQSIFHMVASKTPPKVEVS